MLSGRILNLSQGGLAIETGSALRVGARYRFKVTGGERPADFEGRILWCRLRRTRPAGGDVEPIYRAGIGLEPEEPPESELPGQGAEPATRFGARLEIAPRGSPEPDRPLGELPPEPGGAS